MKTTDAYADLLAMGQPVVTNREAAARWRTSSRTTGQRLRALEDAGLVRHLRRGLWALDMNLDPFVLAPYLTAPYPAYVSLWSALSHHGMIEQIPRQISISSLDRAQRVTTSVGVYDIHHLAPGLFGGFSVREESGYLANPEKALFDTVYVRAAGSRRAFFPELSLPAGFSEPHLREWIDRIVGPRLKTIVSRQIREALKGAGRE
jgi:predicted transcriptional regulator of viral defense system